jgi:hypothetical protein
VIDSPLRTYTFESVENATALTETVADRTADGAASAAGGPASQEDPRANQQDA